MLLELIAQVPREALRMGKFGQNPGAMLIVQIIIIVLALIVVWWILKGQKKDYDLKDSPLEILKKRYAAGEITKKQFEDIKKDLK
jgi:putative membrane protein